MKKENISEEGKRLVKEIDDLAEEVLTPPEVEVPLTQKGVRRIKLIANVCFCAAVGLCALLTLVVLLHQFAGGIGRLRFSVEPTNAFSAVPRGSILVTLHRPPEAIHEGDIISYYALPGELDTRLTRYVSAVQRDGDAYSFETRRSPDAPPDSIALRPASILGVKVLVLKRFGFVTSFLAAYAGGLAWCAVALGVAAVLLRKFLLTRGVRPRKAAIQSKPKPKNIKLK